MKIGAAHGGDGAGQLARGPVALEAEVEGALDLLGRCGGGDALRKDADAGLVLQCVAWRGVAADDVVVQDACELPALVLCQLRQVAAAD